MADTKKLRDNETERNRVRKLNEMLAELLAKQEALENRVAALEAAAP